MEDDNYEVVTDVATNGYIHNEAGQILLKKGGLMYYATYELDANESIVIKTITPANESLETITPHEEDELENVDNNTDGHQWTENETKILLSTVISNKIGGAKYKTKAKQWEAIAESIKLHKIRVTGAQCRSRMNTLERGYKRVLDHSSKSGRNRKRLNVSPEVKKMLDDLYGKKDNVTLPPLLEHRSDMAASDIMEEMQREGQILNNVVQVPERQLEEEVDDPDPENENDIINNTPIRMNKSRKATVASEISHLRKERKEMHLEKLEMVKSNNNSKFSFFNKTTTGSIFMQ